MEDEQRFGEPSTAHTNESLLKVRDLIKSDHRLTVRMIAYELNLSHQTVNEILTHDFNILLIYNSHKEFYSS